MTDLDDKILQAMKAQNQSLHESPEETYVPGLIKQSFKGPFKVTFLFILVFTLIAAALGVYCAIEMLNVDSVQKQLNWLAGTFACVLIVVVLRLWFFMELNRLSVIREIKRVELQLAVLATKIDQLK